MWILPLVSSVYQLFLLENIIFYNYTDRPDITGGYDRRTASFLQMFWTTLQIRQFFFYSFNINSHLVSRSFSCGKSCSVKIPKTQTSGEAWAKAVLPTTQQSFLGAPFKSRLTKPSFIHFGTVPSYSNTRSVKNSAFSNCFFFFPSPLINCWNNTTKASLKPINYANGNAGSINHAHEPSKNRNIFICIMYVPVFLGNICSPQRLMLSFRLRGFSSLPLLKRILSR